MVSQYLDCGCPRVKSDERSWCPSCGENLEVANEMHMPKFELTLEVSVLKAKLAEAVRRVDYMQSALERVQQEASENTLVYPRFTLDYIERIAGDALDYLFDRGPHKQKGKRDYDVT